MTLRVMGADGIGQLFDEVVDLAAEGWKLLAADPRYEVVVEPTLSTLVFRYIPAPSPTPPRSTAPISTPARPCSPPATRWSRAPRSGGRHYLKFTLLNPETTTEDIASVLDLIAEHAEQYLGARQPLSCADSARPEPLPDGPRMSSPMTSSPIGLGPFNLGLACLTEPIDELDGLFLECKPDFDWHAGMLLDGAPLQTPFMSDLVTLADPTSPYSFLNYLKESGRLYSFYIRENFYPLRAEYDDYCRWAAGQALQHPLQPRGHRGHLRRSRQAVRRQLRPHRRAPTAPATWCSAPAPRPSSRRPAGASAATSSTTPAIWSTRRAAGQGVHHDRRQRAERGRDLLRPAQRHRRHGYRLNWVTRSPRFFPLEYTKLTLEMTSPEYVDYFHALPEATRYRLTPAEGPVQGHRRRPDQRDLRSALPEEPRRTGPTRLLTNTALTGAAYDERYVHPRAAPRGAGTGLHAQHPGPGPRHRLPLPDAGVPEAVRDRIARTPTAASTSPATTRRHHRPRHLPAERRPPTHSITCPDLGMGPYRNSLDHPRAAGHASTTRSRSRSRFQEFGAPESTPDTVFTPRDPSASPSARSTPCRTPSCCTAGSPTPRRPSG